MENKNSGLKDKIFEYIMKLPRGKTTTYKKIAERFNTSPRVVGMILKSNTNKSVPCYKVIRSDGKIGGYNKLHGKSKKKLIEQEKTLNLIL